MDELIAKVNARSLIVVVGTSGSGKSSLVFAGLQPRLKENGWLVEDCRLGSEPFYRLAAALVKLLDPMLMKMDLVREAESLSDRIQKRGLGEVVASLTQQYRGRSLWRV